MCRQDAVAKLGLAQWSPRRALDILSSVRVRLATRGDVDALARVQRRSWQHAYRGVLSPRWLAAMDPERLCVAWRRRIARGRETAFVAELDGVVRGYVSFGRHDDPSWRGGASEIWMIYVEPEYLRRGVGRALFERACAELERAGYRWLVVRVLADNASARAFYARLGLRLDGHVARERVGDGVHEVLRYARALRPVVDLAALVRVR